MAGADIDRYTKYYEESAASSTFCKTISCVSRGLCKPLGMDHWNLLRVIVPLGANGGIVGG